MGAYVDVNRHSLDGKLVQLGTTGGTGEGSTAASGTIALTDNVSNYKFLLVITAYYSHLQAVYGYSLIPKQLYSILEEYMYYPVHGGNGVLRFDSYSRKTDNEIAFICGSSFPISIYGLK